jgi:hypothetical protein
MPPFIDMNACICFSPVTAQRLSHRLELYAPRTNIGLVFDKRRPPFGRKASNLLRHTGYERARTRCDGFGRASGEETDAPVDRRLTTASGGG